MKPKFWFPDIAYRAPNEPLTAYAPRLLDALGRSAWRPKDLAKRLGLAHHSFALRILRRANWKREYLPGNGALYIRRNE